MAEGISLGLFISSFLIEPATHIAYQSTVEQNLFPNTVNSYSLVGTRGEIVPLYRAIQYRCCRSCLNNYLQ